MSVADSAMSREALREISKRQIDISALDVHASHGVLYLRGRVDQLRGQTELDLEREIHTILRVLKQKPGVRDVVCEIEIGEPSVTERMRPHIHKHVYR